jgi:hypothetical protein
MARGWMTRSRLRTALALLFFLSLFGLSLKWMFPRHVTPPPVENPEFLPDSAKGGHELLPTLTAFVSLVGTVSTVILAWRADRRATKESNLKLMQLEQQISTL